MWVALIHYEASCLDSPNACTKHISLPVCDFDTYRAAQAFIVVMRASHGMHACVGWLYKQMYINESQCIYVCFDVVVRRYKSVNYMHN